MQHNQSMRHTCITFTPYSRSQAGRACTYFKPAQKPGFDFLGWIKSSCFLLGTSFACLKHLLSVLDEITPLFSSSLKLQMSEIKKRNGRLSVMLLKMCHLVFTLKWCENRNVLFMTFSSTSQRWHVIYNATLFPLVYYCCETVPMEKLHRM